MHALPVPLRRSSGLLAIGFAFSLAFTGCTKPDEPSSQNAPRKVRDETRDTNNPGAGLTLGMPPGPPTVSPEAHLPQHAELFNGFYKFINDKGRVAKNVEELVATGYISPLPLPPPGKKYLLNNQSLELKVVDIK